MTQNKKNNNLYEVAKTDLPIIIDISNGKTIMTLEKDKNIIFGNNMELIIMDKNFNEIKRISDNKTKNSSIKEKEIMLKNAWTNIDWQQQVDYWYAKSDYIINSKPNYNITDGFLVFEDKVEIPVGWQIVKADDGKETDMGWQGDLIVLNTNRKEVGRFHTPIYYENSKNNSSEKETCSASKKLSDIQNGDKSPVNDKAMTGTYRIKEINGKYVISVVVPLSWLLSADRTYPVTIDPTASNTYATGNIASCYYPSFNSVGMNVTIPPGSNVTATSSQCTYRAISPSWRSDGWIGFQSGSNLDGYWYCNVNSPGICTVTGTSNSTIANGTYPSGIVPFTLKVSRDYPSGSCNTAYLYVQNSTWKELVTYTTPCTLPSAPTLALPANNANVQPGKVTHFTWNAPTTGTAPFTYTFYLWNGASWLNWYCDTNKYIDLQLSEYNNASWCGFTSQWYVTTSNNCGTGTSAQRNIIPFPKYAGSTADYTIIPNASCQTSGAHSIVQGDGAYYSFNATAGNTYSFSTCSTDLGCGTSTGWDTYLKIYGTDGSCITSAYNDDGGGCLNYESFINGWTCIASGTYYLQITGYNSFAYGTYYLQYKMTCPTVTANLSGGSSPICNNTVPAIFTATGLGGNSTYTYLWYLNGSPTGLTSQTYTAPALSANATVYCAVSSCGQTINTITYTVIVYDNLTANISGGISPICSGTSPGTLTATALGGTGNYTYLWFKDSVSTGITSQTYNPGNLTATSAFYCEVTNGQCGTVNTLTTTITLNPLPIANAGNDTTIISGSSIQIGSSPISGYTYLWSPTVGLSDSTIANPIANPAYTIGYHLIVEDTLGCISLDSINIIVVNNLLLRAITHSVNIINDTAEAILVSMGAQVVYSSSYFNCITVLSNALLLDSIKNLPWVLSVDSLREPIAVNDNSRNIIHVNDIQIQQSGPLTNCYQLSGQNVNIGIWDLGVVDANIHDFTIHPANIFSRVTPMEPITVCEGGILQLHPTIVTGTMAGDGFNSVLNGGTLYQWAGMAPKANIYSWSFYTAVGNPINDCFGPPISTDEMLSGVINQNILISQNSWTWNIQPPFGCAYFGFYDYYFGTQLDKLERDQNLSIFFAAGNWRGTSQAIACGLTNGYGTIGAPNTSKNIITVGALDINQNMAPFSSWGPTIDGRLKPEIVALGVNVNSTNLSNGYTIVSGTSIACPAASGTAALLIERFNQDYFTNPNAALLKAIMLNTATDWTDGGNPNLIGPDYQSGYGLVNAQKAVIVMDNNYFTTNNINNAGINDYILNVQPSSEPLKVMLAYSDKEGQPVYTVPGHDLINDLDLELIDPFGIHYFPLTLDPNNPANPATTSANHRDNVEQVVVQNPIPGNWTVRVIGFNILQGPQEYALVWDGISKILPTNNPICTGDNTTLTASGGGTYLWSTSQTTASITVSPIVTTSYTVTITDINGCTITDGITVIVLPAPILTYTTTDESCYGTTDGSIDLTVTGGTSPYTYNWENSNNVSYGSTQDITNLISDIYYVTVTGANGCTATESIVINNAIPIAWPYQPDNGDYRESGTSVGVDAFGNVFAAGVFTDNISFIGPSVTYNFTSLTFGTQNSYIVKLNECAEVTWAKPLYSLEGVTIKKIIVDGNDDFIITGFFTGTVAFGNGYSGTSIPYNDRLFVAKYHWNPGANDYDCQWLYMPLPISIGRGYDLAIDAANDIYVVGNIMQTNSDIYITKLNSTTGIEDWNNIEITAGADFGYGITYCSTCTAGSKILITGQKGGFVFISEYDEINGGVPIASQTYSTPQQRTGNCLVSYYDIGALTNFVYVAGFTKDIYTNIKAILLMKVDVTNIAVPIFAYSYGGTNLGLGDIATDMDIDQNGDLFITGQFSSSPSLSFPGTALPLSNNGYVDNFVAKFSTSNDLFDWAINSGSASVQEQSFAIDINSNDFGYITGTFIGQAQFGSVMLYDDSPDHHGDVFIARLHDLISIGEYARNTNIPSNTISDNEFLVYPNPTSDELFVDFKFDEISFAKVKLFNILGMQVNNTIEGYWKDEKAVIDVRRLTPGMYMLKIETNKRIYDYKIIIE